MRRIAGSCLAIRGFVRRVATAAAQIEIQGDTVGDHDESDRTKESLITRDHPTSYVSRFTTLHFDRVADLAKAPYAPTTMLICRDVAVRFRLEVVEFDRGSLEDTRQCIGFAERTAARCEEKRLAVPPALYQKCRLLCTLNGSDGFILTHDATVKLAVAAQHERDTNAETFEAALHSEKRRLEVLEQSIMGGAGCMSLPDDSLLGALKRVLNKLNAVEDATPSDLAVIAALRCRRFALMNWLCQTLQGFIALCGEAGHWQGAVIAMQELLALQDLFAQEQRVTSNMLGVLAAAVKEQQLEESSDERNITRWRYTVAPELQRIVREGIVNGNVLSRVVKACAAAKQFDVAFQLSQQAVECAFSSTNAASPHSAVTPERRKVVIASVLSTATMVSLADCIDTKEQLDRFRGIFVSGSQTLEHIPVSTELYTALIHACARAVDEPDREAISLSLYRHLQDTQTLVPSTSLYEGLIKVAASVGKPDTAFGFFHECRALVGMQGPSASRIYAALVESYAKAGYADDAISTVEVLAEAGAPLNRDAFHSAMAFAPFDTAKRLLQSMSSEEYGIAPTPITYAYVLGALNRAQGLSNEERLLLAADHHAEMLDHLAVHQQATTGHASSRSTSEAAPPLLTGTHSSSVTLEAVVLAEHTEYIRRLEEVLLRLRLPVVTGILLLCDPITRERARSAADSKTAPALWQACQYPKYLGPLERLAQIFMARLFMDPWDASLRGTHPVFGTLDVAELIGRRPFSLAPQRPTRVPATSHIAVIAGDVLCAGVYHALAPVLHRFSCVVIPYSSLLEFRRCLEKWLRKPDTWIMRQTSQVDGRRYTFDRAEDDPKMRAQRAVASLQTLLLDHGESVHIGSLAEELLTAQQLPRVGLSSRQQKERQLRVPPLRRRALCFAACLIHPNVLKEYDDACEALEAADGRGVESQRSRLRVYADAQSSVAFITRDGRLRKLATALGRAMRQFRQGQTYSDPTGIVENPMGYEACFEQRHRRHRPSDSAGAARVPGTPRPLSLQAYDPDSWPSWMLDAARSAPRMAAPPPDDAACAEINDDMLRILLGEL